MKHTATFPNHLPVTIRNLRITTALRLHPEFLRTPLPFARRNGVDLADDMFPQTDFRKKPDDPAGDERIEKPKLNIHLVRHGAIRLFAEYDNDDCLVRSIDLNPSKLLYMAERRRLRAGDLPLSLNILKAQVAPLLAEPPEADHVIPGLERDGKPEAFWSLVDGEVYIPGIDIRCLHGLSHPHTGPAVGAKKNRIQLGDKKDDCLIRFKKAKWEIDGADGPQDIEGARVRLILKGRVLTHEFRPFGIIAKVEETMGVVAFSESSISRVHQAVMARLDGNNVPVPAAWLDSKIKKKKDCVTHAKVMALASRLTSIPLEEIRAMDEEVRKPSESTRKRLNKDLPIEVGRLAPVPVSTLFQPPMYASQSSGSPSLTDNIDPAIADAYGER